MRGGTSLSWRVGLILLVGLMAGWLALIAASYIGRGYGEPAMLASPLRLAAIADLIETTDPDDRQRVLDAIGTPHLAVWVEPRPLTQSILPELNPLDATRIDAYRDALAGRSIVITPLDADHPLGRAVASALSAVEFQIALAGGETLVVTSESPLIVARIGLPVGFGAGLVAVLVALVSLITLHGEFRPLKRLAAAVDRVDPSLGTPPLPPIRARSSEVRALVAAFERLQGRVQTLIRARLALVGGIQHDLRTFATRLRLRAERIADPDDRARATADIADMIALMDDALLASRAGACELDEELVDIALLTAAEVEDRQAAGSAVDFVLQIGDRPDGLPEVMVLGDRLALRRMVANLVDNALAYGHRAHVTLSVIGPNVVLIVDDEGPGIPASQRLILLEPFTRTESSRARHTGGAGLGLAMVRSLADAHGGAVAIGNSPMGGARLTLTLPHFETHTAPSFDQI